MSTLIEDETFKINNETNKLASFKILYTVIEPHKTPDSCLEM